MGASIATPRAGQTDGLSDEQVLVERPHERRGARPVLLGHVARQPADDHGGLARGLVADEVGGGRGLGRDGDRGRPQLEPARVPAPAPVKLAPRDPIAKP